MIIKRKILEISPDRPAPSFHILLKTDPSACKSVHLLLTVSIFIFTTLVLPVYFATIPIRLINKYFILQVGLVF